jgi:hypothetical protein
MKLAGDLNNPLSAIRDDITADELDALCDPDRPCHERTIARPIICFDDLIAV